MPEHLRAGVSDEGQLVFVGGLDVLHQRGEGVSAAVRGVFPAIGYNGVKVITASMGSLRPSS